MFERFLALMFGCFFICFHAAAQRDYAVGEATWTFTKPETFQVREDNFKKIIAAGDSVIRAEYPEASDKKQERMLVSIAKTPHSNMNLLLASCSDNRNIAQFGLNGYIEQLKNFIADKFKKDGDSVRFESKQLLIGSVPFSVLRTRVTVPERSLTYWSEQYVAEVADREFSVTIVYDNETDRDLLEKSIEHSAFTGISSRPKSPTRTDTLQLIAKSWSVSKMSMAGKTQIPPKPMSFVFKGNGDYLMSGLKMPDGPKMVWKYNAGMIGLFEKGGDETNPGMVFYVDQVSGTSMILTENSKEQGKIYLKSGTDAPSHGPASKH